MPQVTTGVVMTTRLAKPKEEGLVPRLSYPVRWLMTFLQDLGLFPDRKRGAHTMPKMIARTRSAAPGTRKAAQNPNAEASKPPPIGPRAKPAEVAEEAMPKAVPCRSGGATSFITKFATGMAQPKNRLVMRRNTQSSVTFAAKAWSIAVTPASASDIAINHRGPKRLTSLPPSSEPKDATNAPVPMIQPAWLAILPASLAKVWTNPGRATDALVIDTWTANRARRPGSSSRYGRGAWWEPMLSSCSWSPTSSRRGLASDTPSRTSAPETASRDEVTTKEVLMPPRSALTPPRAGPTPAATNITVCKAPSLQPARSGGAVKATKAVAAGTVPVSVPCKSLSPRSCQGA